MLSKYKEKFLPIVSIVARPFMSVHPNVISLIGFLFSFVFAILLINEYYVLAIVSFAGIFTDTIDGYVARTTGKVSAFGGFLDSTLDRTSDFIIINAFAIAGIVRWEITLTLTLFSFLVSYVRSRAELAGNGKFVLDVGLMERTERLASILVVLVVDVVLTSLDKSFGVITLGFLIIIALSMITVLQRIYQAYLYFKNQSV